MHIMAIGKSIVLLLLALSTIQCTSPPVIDLPSLESLLGFLTNEQQNHILQSLLASRDAQGRQDNSNWCCKVDPGK